MHITVLKCSVPEQPITITNKPVATSKRPILPEPKGADNNFI
jgi:hypothetical protein